MFWSVWFVVYVMISTPYTVFAIEMSDDKGGEIVDPYNKVLETFGLLTGQKLSSKNVSSLIEELFIHKFKCIDQLVAPNTCLRCLTADNIFSIIEVSPAAGLDRTSFEKASVVLLSYLLNLSQRCKNISSPLSAHYVEYLDGLRKFNQVSQIHQLIDAVMERLNTTYSPTDEHEATGTDEHNHGNDTVKCVDEEKFIEILNVTETDSVTTTMTERLAAAVVYYLFSGYQMKTTCPRLPNKEDFINDIYALVAGGGTTITENQFIELLTKLKIGTGTGIQPDGHSHRRKRSVEPEVRRSKRWSGSINEILATLDRRESLHASTEPHVLRIRQVAQRTVTQCLDVHQYMTVYGIEEALGVSKTQFSDLCPALIQQQLSGACATATPTTPLVISHAQSYGYGTLLVLVISLLSILGALFVPCMNSTVYNALIVFFIALAVSTLTGDALIHLMPQALGIHNDAPGTVHHEGVEDFVWKQLVVIGAIYLFFLVEIIMHFIRNVPISENGGHGHSHSLPKKASTTKSRDMNGVVSDKHHRHHSDGDHKHHPHHSDGDLANGDNGFIVDSTTHSYHKHHIVSPGLKSANGQMMGLDNPAFTASSTDIVLSEISHNSTNVTGNLDKNDSADLENYGEKKKWNWKDIRSVAVMILVGDTLHNFIDGIAIGAAFAQDLNSGISTSVAVLCHELPHELGDFAVLLNSGMPMKWVMVLSLISSVTAFMGLYMGLAIAVDIGVRQWIFAVTAGMFLYVALVDMLPELMRHRAGGRLKTFILQNFGLMVGFGIMLLIGIYEEKITIA